MIWLGAAVTGPKALPQSRELAEGKEESTAVPSGGNVSPQSWTSE